jgi:hypothetical protein
VFEIQNLLLEKKHRVGNCVIIWGFKDGNGGKFEKVLGCVEQGYATLKGVSTAINEHRRGRGVVRVLDSFGDNVHVPRTGLRSGGKQGSPSRIVNHFN